MSDQNPHVIVITDDAKLRAALARRRPTNLRLLTRTTKQLRQGPLPPAKQIWLDLDATRDTELPRCERNVYFHTDARGIPKRFPRGLLIRKPCQGPMIDVLWAGVAPDPVPAPDNASPQHKTGAPDVLPAWVVDFMDLNLKSFCHRCVTRLPALLGFQDVSLYLHSADDELLTLAETNHKRPVDLAMRLTEAKDKLMVAVARARRPFLSRNPALDAADLGARLESDRYPKDGCLIMPLYSDGQLWGVLNLSHPSAQALPAEALPLDLLARFFGRALHHATVCDRARTEARVDGLTGIYNYRWMLEALNREIRRSQRFGGTLCLIMLDLDGFKQVNDRFGHAAGDAVLRNVAAQVNNALRRFDAAARVGGDEFVVLLPATDLRGARQVARRLHKSIRSTPAFFHGRPITTSVSIGVAQWNRQWDAGRLIETADVAMYSAKNNGRNRIVYHPHDAATDASRACSREPATTSGNPP